VFGVAGVGRVFVGFMGGEGVFFCFFFSLLGRRGRSCVVGGGLGGFGFILLGWVGGLVGGGVGVFLFFVAGSSWTVYSGGAFVEGLWGVGVAELGVWWGLF